MDHILELNESVFLDGRGGCGKSHLIRMVQKRLRELGKNYVSLAPTNLAALRIGGMTVNRFFGSLRNKKSLEKKNLSYRTFLILLLMKCQC